MKQPTVVVNYFGRRGSGPEYALGMARGLIGCGCSVYALLSEDIANMPQWRKLPLAEIVTVKLSDHYQGAAAALWRFFTRDLRSLREHYKQLRIDAYYIPMVHPLSVPVERMFRHLGAKTFFTFHDVMPHAGERTAHYLPIHLAAAHLARKSDTLTLLTDRFRSYVASRYGRQSENDIIITPHPTFDSYAECADSPPPLPLAEINFLVFGRIVRYKGLDIMAEAYRTLCGQTDLPTISLRIVGSGDFTPYAKLYNGMPGVHVDNRFIPNSEVMNYFRMPHTVVVLPYTEASQSGVIPLAMKEECQLVVSRLEGLMEQTADGKFSEVCEPNSTSLAEALRRVAISFDSLAPMRKAASVHINSLTWEGAARAIVEKLPH